MRSIILSLAFAAASCTGGDNNAVRADMGTPSEDMTSGSDTGTPDAGSPDAAAPDLSPSADVSQNDAELPANVCESAAITETIECDVVDQTGCPQGAACSMVFVASEMRPRPACVAPDPTATIAPGSACGGAVQGRCEQTAVCYQSVCTAVCRLSDGAGCDPGQFCKINDATIAPFDIGFCADSC